MKKKESLVLKKENKTIEIKKHSSLIQIDNRNISYYGKKLFNGIIYLVKKQLEQEPEKEEFDITLAELKNISGLEQANNHLLKESLIAIQDTMIEYNLLGKDKEEIWKRMNLISELTYIVQGEASRGLKGKRGKIGYFTVSLPPTIRKSIKNPNMFSKLNLFLLKNLTSKYSINLYEFLKDYEKKPRWPGIISVELTTLKQIIGIEKEKYSAFAMFRRRIIDPALEQINQSMDLFVSYKTKKTGKKYTHIEFSITNKNKEIPKRIVSGEDIEMEMKLKNYFMLGSKQIKEIMGKYTDYELLEHRLSMIEVDYKKGKINNIGPYTYKVLSESSMVKKSLFDVEIEEEKEEQKKQAELEQKKKETEERKKKEEAEKIRQEAEDYYISLSQEKKEELLEEYETSLNDILKKQYKRYGVESPLFRGQFYLFIYEKIKR